MKTAGKIIKVVALSISFFIFAFFLFRILTMGDPDSLTSIDWNPAAKEAYLKDPESFSAVSQKQQVFITNDGKFWISGILYLREAKQLQLTIKYNDSTLKALAEQIEGELPEEPFSYSLLDSAGTRYTDYDFRVERKQNYSYRRLIFYGIDLTDIATVYVDIYYSGAVDYEQPPYSSLMTWNRALPVENIDVIASLPDDLK